MNLYYGALLMSEFSDKVPEYENLILKKELQKFIDENKQDLFDSWLCINRDLLYIGFLIDIEWVFNKEEIVPLLGLENYLKNLIPKKTKEAYFEIMLKIYSLCKEKTATNKNFGILAENMLHPEFFIIHQFK